jgi:Mrp family chromosome partitioning ATPase
MRTLLIDADTRGYSLTSIYGAQHEGLTDLLQNEDAANQDSYIMQMQEGLYFMPLGTKRDHAIDILLSPYGKSLMSELSKGYDFIVIDAPSLLHYSDVEMFAESCQHSLLVIRSGMANINDIRNIEKLENDGFIKNVQLILNGGNNR